MPEIDPSQLFDHFVEAVRLLAASAQEQIDWVDSKICPYRNSRFSSATSTQSLLPAYKKTASLPTRMFGVWSASKQQYTIWSRISVKTPTVVLA